VIPVTVSNPKLKTWPHTTGVGCLISRASIFSGTKLISQTENFNHLYSYKSIYKSNEHSLEYDPFTSGAYRGYNSKTMPGELLSLGSTHGYQYENDTVVAAGSEYTLNYTAPPSCMLNETTEFQIPLSDLFEWLRNHQLPLYALKEQLSLEVEFTSEQGAGKRYIQDEAVTSATDYGSVVVDTNKLLILADYIYYDNGRMEQLAGKIAEQRLSVPYFDYQGFKFSVGRGATTKESIHKFLGGANKVVDDVLISTAVEPGYDVNGSGNNSSFDPLNGVYNSCSHPTDRNPAVEVNLYYNNKYLFPRDIDTNTKLYTALGDTEGYPPQISEQEYCCDNIRDSAVAAEKRITSGARV